MTLKDYATIQRNLGYIEGVVDKYNEDDDKAAVFDAISVIDEPKQKTEPVREVKNAPSVCTPSSGTLYFADCSTSDALNAAFAVLGKTEYATITISWSKIKLQLPVTSNHIVK